MPGSLLISGGIPLNVDREGAADIEFGDALRICPQEEVQAK
jgi:hypothetical protein